MLNVLPDHALGDWERARCCDDGDGHRITFLFDPVGRDAGSIDPLGRRVTFGYDPAGRKLFKLDPRLNRSTFGYDAASQRIKDIFADGLRTSYAYDPVGNLIRWRTPETVLMQIEMCPLIPNCHR